MNKFGHITNRQYLRIIFAGAFLFVMLVEWGSHSLAFVHAERPEGLVAVSSPNEHSDPCKTLVHGSDGRRQDQVPNLSHDRTQQNSYSGIISGLGNRSLASHDASIFREDAHRLFRPAEPPTQPPQNS